MEIFLFYRGAFDLLPAWWWKNLTDVCRRWREVTFASPRFLDLRLGCTQKTPTRTSLDIWPPFPITIASYRPELDDRGQDNIIAALEHHDRVIQIHIECYRLETYFAVTRKPFPGLTRLELMSYGDKAPVLDEEFLGGSAPHLREIFLFSIAFPAFPKLALSCSSLSALVLSQIPIAGYISPEAMATCLATLPNLRYLSIGFRSPQSRPDRIGLPPSTRVVLPVLEHFEFEGVSEYLEDLVAGIDTPNPVRLTIHLFMEFMVIPQLSKFIVRTEGTKSLKSAEIMFSSSATWITFGHVKLEIICWDPHWQTSLMAQVCRQISPLLSHVEQLDIREDTRGQERQWNGIDPTQFLGLFHHFPAMQRLQINRELVPLVARALQESTGESATEVFPSLHSLVFKDYSLSGSIQKDIEGFITARQNSNHPVGVEWREWAS